MFGYLDFLFLSYAGRIGRTAYWLGFFFLNLLEIGALMLLVRLSHGTFEQLAQLPHTRGTLSKEEFDLVVNHLLIPLGIIYVLFLYPSFAITTKRWHDRDKSGWWSLVMFVPIIGAFWAFIELALLGGTEGANSYGVRD
jgi:uncharacterized membrane protein YhaH (DUF805 family)